MSKITDVRYVAYGVTDLQAERSFYKDVWKLEEAAEADGMVYFAAVGSPHPYQVRLRASDKNRIDCVGFEAESAADVDELASRVAEAGCKIISGPEQVAEPGGGYGFKFFSPDGLIFEIVSGAETRESREVKQWEGIPERISHVVLHSPDHKKMVDFFCDVLGFKQSDWLGDFMCFMRCNEWHHRVAVLPGPPCLDHVAYDVPSVDDMMMGLKRLRANEFDVRWGPGRHTAGNNTFSYYVTPGENVVEYTAELEKVNETEWQPTVYKPSLEIMDQWGIGVGGPATMPKAKPDSGLFQPVEV